MEFLMILSALLSAVTGAFAGNRPADARQHQPAPTQSVAAAAPVARVAVPAARPVQAIPAQAARILPVPALAAPLASAPVETDRLIE
jgi:hypothetical protein